MATFNLPLPISELRLFWELHFKEFVKKAIFNAQRHEEEVEELIKIRQKLKECGYFCIGALQSNVYRFIKDMSTHQRLIEIINVNDKYIVRFYYKYCPDGHHPITEYITTSNDHLKWLGRVENPEHRFEVYEKYRTQITNSK